MSFPIITGIADVLWAIEGRSDFIVFDKGDYKVVDYVYTLTDSFDEPIRKELRGIKFGPTGKIIARPFHKFFNLGEREWNQENVDWSKHHTIHNKFDGSMVHTVILNGEVRLMTRMGLTDVALEAEKLLTGDIIECVKQHPRFTFIFEYVGPENRIVLSYEKPELILLAIREIHTGIYLSNTNLFATFPEYIKVADPIDFDHIKDISEFADHVKALSGVEGFVVKFGDDWFKIKAEEYVLKHHVKDAIRKESHVVELILLNQLDDILPALDQETHANLAIFEDNVLKGMSEVAHHIQGLVDSGRELDQKAFATIKLRDVPDKIRSVAFLVRKLNQPAWDVLIEYLKKHIEHKDIDELRILWNGHELVTREDVINDEN